MIPVSDNSESYVTITVAVAEAVVELPATSVAVAVTVFEPSGSSQAGESSSGAPPHVVDAMPEPPSVAAHATDTCSLTVYVRAPVNVIAGGIESSTTVKLKVATLRFPAASRA